MTAEQLKNYDFILLLDKSGSMSESDGSSSGKTKWQSVQEEVLNIARECTKYDTNGITVVPFNATWKKYENVDGGPELITKIFAENRPSGGTDTAGVMKDVLDEYIATKGTAACKPIIVICVTDGVPDDEAKLARVIVDATKKLDNEEEIGITFLQIGKNDAARAFLKRLDDNLTSEGAKFDIVDTHTMDEIGDMSLTEVFLNAVND